MSIKLIARRFSICEFLGLLNIFGHFAILVLVVLRSKLLFEVSFLFCKYVQNIDI